MGWYISRMVILDLGLCGVTWTWAHSQENQVNYQIVYSNLEEDSLSNLQKFTKHG